MRSGYSSHLESRTAIHLANLSSDLAHLRASSPPHPLHVHLETTPSHSDIFARPRIPSPSSSRAERKHIIRKYGPRKRRNSDNNHRAVLRARTDSIWDLQAGA
jgi:hypothetical protein